MTTPFRIRAHRRATLRTALRSVATASIAAFTLAACDRSATEPTVEGLTVREVIIEASDGTFAFSHRDHWHGAPVVRASGTVGLRFHFTDVQLAPDDHDAPPVEEWFTLDDRPEYEVRLVIEDTTVASWTGDRRGGTLHGRREGASRLSVVVRRNGTTIHEAPPLNFRVQPPAP